MEFKKLEFHDLELIRSYYSEYTNRTCDRTIGGSFMWRDYFHTMYALVDDTLVMKCKKDGETVFCFPMGKQVDGALSEIEKYCEKEGIAPEFVSLSVEEMEYLKERYKDATVIENRDWSDYLYLTSDHANFSGRKFTTQRNHINKFLKTYANWEFKIIDDTTLSDVKDFYKDYETRFAKSDKTAVEEQEKTNEVLEKYKDYGFVGYALYIENKVVGFALGEILGDIMFIHVEKADKSLDGVNTMLVMQFAKAFEGQVTYLNREEDVGDLGLRYSKTKYRPIDMVYKYEVNFKKVEILGNPLESRSLYEESFEDSKEFVDYYYTHMATHNHILTLKIKEEIAAMLHIVPKQFHYQKEADYYYAIATAKKHRKKGYMERLLKKAMKFSYRNQKGLVYLVPAINGLYEKFGFASFGVRFSPLTICSKRNEYEKTVYEEYSGELASRLRTTFTENIAPRFDDYIERDETYYEVLLNGLFAEGGKTEILSKAGVDEGYILESDGGIWEAALPSLPEKNYALARIVNVEKVAFDETKLQEGYYQIEDRFLPENQGLFYFRKGRFISATTENIMSLGLTEADRGHTRVFDISELILYLKYEKVYVSDEI